MIDTTHYGDHNDHIGARALKLHLDEHLSQCSLANSLYHTRQLPVNLCEEIAARYRDRGWQVAYTITEGTSFSFVRRSG